MNVAEIIATEFLLGGPRQIDGAPAHKRPAVIDSHHDRAPVVDIGDLNMRAKRQRAMSRRQCP